MTMGKQIFYHNLKNGGIPELTSYLEILKEQHKELEKKIASGYTHYLDDEHLGKIKHEKLGIKRQIVEIEEKLKAHENEA
jgi:hypothetical protein